MDTDARVYRVRQIIESIGETTLTGVMIQDFNMRRLCQIIIQMFEPPAIKANSYDVAMFLIENQNCQSKQDLADRMMKKFDIGIKQ